MSGNTGATWQTWHRECGWNSSQLGRKSLPTVFDFVVVAVAYPKTGMYLLPPPKILEASKSANSNSKEQTNQNNRPTDQPTNQAALFFCFCFNRHTYKTMALASNFCISGLSGRGDPRTLGRDRSKPRLLRRNRGAGDRICGWWWVGMTGSFSPETIPHE